MNLDFSDEQKELQEQVRRFLAAQGAATPARTVLDGEAPYDRALYRGLAEMGVLGAAIPEAYGGLGLGYLEACLFAEELGRVLAPVPVSSSIYLVAEFLLRAGSEAQKRRWLPRLASGDAVGAFASIDAKEPVRLRDGKLTGTKAPVLDGLAADVAIVAVHGDATSLHLVDLDGVTRTSLNSIDPSRKQAALTFADTPAEPLGDGGDATPIIDAVLDAAAVLTAFEQLGGADRALEMARDYALDRMAFGRPIGSFQAIKHMLADMYVSATLARSNAYYGAWALASGAPELPVAAATARVSATQAFQHCARNNIQVHGGMGFTWEFDCHLFYRRSNLLALSLGSLSSWEAKLIDRMCAGNRAAAA